jgi:hypothetical protein
MPEIDGVLFCDGCGAEIVGAPVVGGRMRYCCERCARGESCDCALILDDDEPREAGSPEWTP